VYLGRDTINTASQLQQINLPIDANLILMGESRRDRAGSSVAAGDINGDGFDDVIIGVPREDTGGNFAGAVYVYLGRNLQLSQPMTVESLSAATLKVTGEAPYDLAGASVAAGDINGDEIDDIIIGAPSQHLYNNSAVGAVYVWPGTTSQLTFSSPQTFSLADADLKLTGEASRDYAGSSVASGDINGDDIDDLIAGASQLGSNDTGGAYIYLGRQNLISGFPSQQLSLSNADFKLIGDAGDKAGVSVATGDINNDGTNEVKISITQTELLRRKP